MSCCLSIEIMMCSGSFALAERSAFSSAAGFSFSFSLRAAVAAGAGRAQEADIGIDMTHRGPLTGVHGRPLVAVVTRTLPVGIRTGLKGLVVW